MWHHWHGSRLLVYTQIFDFFYMSTNKTGEKQVVVTNYKWSHIYLNQTMNEQEKKKQNKLTVEAIQLFE